MYYGLNLDKIIKIESKHTQKNPKNAKLSSTFFGKKCGC